MTNYETVFKAQFKSYLSTEDPILETVFQYKSCLWNDPIEIYTKLRKFMHETDPRKLPLL